MKKIIKSLTFLILFTFQFLYAFSQIKDDFYNVNKVNDIRITFKVSNWSHILDSLIQLGDGEQRILADVVINGKKFVNAGIRYKGFSSWHANGSKNPFNISLDYLVKNQNYQGYTKVKLSNVINDPSFVREVLSYEIVRKYMPASKANYANVYVNDTLIGLYTNVESVDNIFTEKNFGNGDNILIKGSPANLEYPFGQNANLAYTHGSDSSGYMPYYKLESDYGWNELYKFIYMLNVDTSQVETMLNIDKTLWMHALNYVLLNLDSYIGYSQNYYLYMDDNGQFNPIMWDLNMSFGSFRFTDATALNLTIAKMKVLNPLQILYYNTFTPRPLIKNILSNPTFRKMFLAHMRTIVNENLKNNFYYNRGLEIQNIIDYDVQNDSNKFYSYEDFVNNMDTTTGSTSNQFPGLKDLMSARILYLDNYSGFQGAPAISKINFSPSIPDMGQKVSITAKVINAGDVILAYRCKSNDIFHKIAMFDDGNHHDSIAGDYIYGTDIISNGHTIQYYFYAENDSAGVFSPERAAFEYYTIQPKINSGDIVINEFSDKWIELYNNTSEVLNLSNLYLSDDPNNISNWAFPDTILNAKSFFIVWKNDSNLNGNLSVNFKLNNSGGQLFLAYDENNIIDRVYFNKTETCKTIGRYPNGVGNFTLMQPSFSKVNYVSINNANVELSLYPNPANNYIYIEVLNATYPLTVEIFNINGQLIYSSCFNYSQNDISLFSKSIDITALNNGVYLTKINFSDKTVTKKFIKY